MLAMIKWQSQQQKICMNMVKYQQMQIIVSVITNKNTKYMIHMQTVLNLNEDVEGGEPEFDDTEPFREALNEVAFKYRI